jgi:hypothetical protein
MSIIVMVVLVVVVDGGRSLVIFIDFIVFVVVFKAFEFIYSAKQLYIKMQLIISEGFLASGCMYVCGGWR